MDKILDIIIPAYNAHSTLDKVLSSILSQYELDKVKVTIVNDCSKEGYEDLIRPYSQFLDINIINLETNVGCGMARQIGLDSTNLPFIMFMDSDDMLYYPLSIKNLLDVMVSDESKNVAYGGIVEYIGDITEYIAPNHFTWIFGSIYRRNFIDKYQIKFPNNSNGEDLGFNKIFKIMNDPNKNIAFLNIPVYLWTDLNKNGRINTEKFKLLDVKLGYILNTLAAYDFVNTKEFEITKQDLIYEILSSFYSIYWQFLQLVGQREEIINTVGIAEYEIKINEYLVLLERLFKQEFCKYLYEIKIEDINFVADINKEALNKRVNVDYFISFGEYLNILVYDFKKIGDYLLKG